MYDLTPIIQAIFSLIVAISTCLLIPYIKSRTTAEQQANMLMWIKFAVQAAEQLFKGKSMGAQKKAFVLNFLEENNCKIDETKINALIESAVYELGK